jgi:hypothetical protein
MHEEDEIALDRRPKHHVEVIRHEAVVVQVDAMAF